MTWITRNGCKVSNHLPNEWLNHNGNTKRQQSQTYPLPSFLLRDNPSSPFLITQPSSFTEIMVKRPVEGKDKATTRRSRKELSISQHTATSSSSVTKSSHKKKKSWFKTALIMFFISVMPYWNVHNFHNLILFFTLSISSMWSTAALVARAIQTPHTSSQHWSSYSWSSPKW